MEKNTHFATNIVWGMLTCYLLAPALASSPSSELALFLLLLHSNPPCLGCSRLPSVGFHVEFDLWSRCVHCFLPPTRLSSHLLIKRVIAAPLVDFRQSHSRCRGSSYLEDSTALSSGLPAISYSCDLTPLELRHGSTSFILTATP